MLYNCLCVVRYDPAKPPVLMIGLDGTRADYVNRGLMPTLKTLYDCGSRAAYMRPSFPSVTFPNFYTLVTVS